MPENNSKKYLLGNAIKIFCCLLVIGSFFILLFQNHVAIFGHIGFGGLFVNDTLGMEENLKRFAEDSDGNFTGIYGVMLLYYPSFYLTRAYTLFVNVTFLIFAAIYFLETLFKLRVRLSLEKVILIFVIILSNLYILQVLYFPNKEIPLILLTNLFLYHFVINKKYTLIFIIILITLFIRDGHALILTLTFILATLFNEFIKRKPIVFLILILALFSILSLEVIGSIGILGEYNYILDRNLDLANNPDSVVSSSILNTVPVYIAYPMKVINHFISSAIRPQFIDINNRVYVAGLGLWQNGIIILLGISSWIHLIRRNENSNIVIIGAIIILGLLLISVGSFTQPRYMMPYIFWLAAGIVLILDIKKIIIFVLIIFLISLLFLFLNLGVPVIPEGFDLHPW